MTATVRCSLISCVLLIAACADQSGGRKEPRYTIVPNPEPVVDTSGIPVEKQADILEVLQHRQPTARKCYNDELNRRADRNFQGEITVIIEFSTKGSASEVHIDRNTLESPEVEGCLIEAIKGFEFPELAEPGQMNYTYHFKPAY